MKRPKPQRNGGSRRGFFSTTAPRVVGLSLIGALLFWPSLALARPETPPGVQDVRGGWAGFYQALSGPDTAPSHPVWLAIDSQFHRCFNGGLKVGGPQPPPFFLIEGLVTARGQTIFHGQSEDGRVIAHVTLHDFGGGAAVFDGRLRLHRRNGSREEGRLLLLRRFIGNPDETPPDVAGDYAGFATSEATGETKAVIIHGRAGLDQTDAPTRGAPTTEFVGDGSLRDPRDSATEWAFQTLGTINSNGQVVAINQGQGGYLILTANLRPPSAPSQPARITGDYAINQGQGGHLILTANLRPPSAPSQPARITGDYLLLLSDGTRDEGTFDVLFAKPPDPDQAE